MEVCFDEYFDMFREELRRLGWDGPVDIDCARMDYESETDAYEAARDLFDELSD